jgi:hypothetical protein
VGGHVRQWEIEICTIFCCGKLTKILLERSRRMWEYNILEENFKEQDRKMQTRSICLRTGTSILENTVLNFHIPKRAGNFGIS